MAWFDLLRPTSLAYPLEPFIVFLVSGEVWNMSKILPIPYFSILFPSVRIRIMIITHQVLWTAAMAKFSIGMSIGNVPTYRLTKKNYISEINKFFNWNFAREKSTKTLESPRVKRIVMLWQTVIRGWEDIRCQSTLEMRTMKLHSAVNFQSLWR